MISPGNGIFAGHSLGESDVAAVNSPRVSILMSALNWELRLIAR